MRTPGSRWRGCCFIWGDVRATTDDQRLAAYDQGREAARRAVEQAPRAPLAHLFDGINTGRWGQTRGVTRSLFLLTEVREAIRKTLELDPSLPQVYALAGNVDYEVPGLFGGSLERAEAQFRKGLGLDPRFTALRIGLAKVLKQQGRAADARRSSLRAILDETAPTNPAEWSMQGCPGRPASCSPRSGPGPAALYAGRGTIFQATLGYSWGPDPVEFRAILPGLVKGFSTDEGVASVVSNAVSERRTPATDGRVLAALCVAAFLASLNFFATTPFYPPMARDLHTTIPLLGQVVTLTVLLSAGLGLVVGPLADRYGYRWPLVIGFSPSPLTWWARASPRLTLCFSA